MKLFDNDYEIEIFEDEMYSPNSTDNKNTYRSEIYDTTLKENNYYSKCGIRLIKDESVFSSVVLLGRGSFTRVGKNSFVLINDILYVTVGCSVFSIKVQDLTLNWVIQADDSCCFEIYSLKDILITHGELSITGIAKDGKIKWQYYGSDIFVTPSGIDDFLVLNDIIKAKDWNGMLHVINCDGKRII